MIDSMASCSQVVPTLSAIKNDSQKYDQDGEEEKDQGQRVQEAE